MNNLTKNQISKSLHKEYLRRLLIKYFTDKGYDNFLNTPYPPHISDLNDQSFHNGNIEILYNVDDILLNNNQIKLAWNLFVLGNKRIFLGYTIHDSFNDIKNCGSIKNHKCNFNIKTIIDSICDWIGETTNIYDIGINIKNKSIINL